MIMLSSVKYLAKSCSSRRPNNLTVLCCCSIIRCLSTTTSSSSFTTVQAKNVALSFKEWFNSNSNKNRNLLHLKMFQILKSQDPNDDVSLPSSPLSHLNLRLSEPFVLEVLRYGKDEENDVLSCLKFFDWAGHQPNFHHTRATFNAIFKILSKAKLMSLMLEFLRAFGTRRGGGQRVRFHETLVMGYAVAGEPEAALQVFSRMRFQNLDLDALGYHVLLNALVEDDRLQGAEAIASQISQRGLENHVTVSIMVKWFCNKGMYDDAEAYMMSKLDKVAGNAVCVLVHALCRRGEALRARDLVDKFSELGVANMCKAYDAWIRNLVLEGKFDEALRFMETNKSLQGYVPYVLTFNFFIGRLLREYRLDEACDVLLEMKECGISPDKGTMNMALGFFCKSGMMDVVLDLYDSRSEFGLTPSSMAYNYLINTICGDGSVDRAYQMLKYSMEQGYCPGRKTFSILANALCREGKIDKMKELIVFALDRNLMPTDFAYEKIITTLCRNNRVEDGYLIHEELQRINKLPTERTYIHLIRGFSMSNKADIGARLLIEMQEHGHSPTPWLFRGVIFSLCHMENPDMQVFNLLEMQLSLQQPSYEIFHYFLSAIGEAKKPELARKVFELMQHSGLQPTVKTDVLMLHSYLKSERISDAVNFFNVVSHRRDIRRKLYEPMIMGLCRARRADIALQLMEDVKGKGLVPTDNCYGSLIQFYCSNLEYDKAVNLISDLGKVGRHITSFIGNTLMFHSFKSQELYNAWFRLRGENEISDSGSISHLIGVFSGLIWVGQSIENYEEVIENCFPPDVFTYNLLIRRVSDINMEHAVALFYRMSQKGHEPNQWTYDILVQGLLKHGRRTEAKRCLEEMCQKGFSPTIRFI